MNMKKVLIGIASCAFMIVSANAQSRVSQTPNKSESQSANRMMNADSNFMKKAAEGGMAEVEFGKLAATQASDSHVKEFGQRMVTDHTKANDELNQLASKKGTSLPTSLNAKDQAMKDKLSKLNGAAFDKMYMDNMVKDHKTDVSEFRTESNSGSDPDLKAFASKTLPTLEEHLKMAQDTYSQLKK
jgi:putative membrane protein